MLHAWGFASAHFIGHSFGTVVMAWVTKLYPAIICRASFLDPVVFLLCVPHMVYKFLYKEPREGIEKLMHFFVSSELYMANMMSRHFIWGEVCPPPRGLEVPQRSPGRAKQRRPAGAQPRGAAVHGQAGPARHRGGLARGRFPRRVPPEAEGAAHPARQASVTRARAASFLRLPASPLPFVRRLSPRRAPLVGGTHLHVFFFAFAARAGRRGASGRASLRAASPACSVVLLGRTTREEAVAEGHPRVHLRDSTGPGPFSIRGRPALRHAAHLPNSRPAIGRCG
ncbi:unnamed protein product [Prorocentrum cordatum]|nr:unnamed protein product [Polarella glacialis]